MKEKLTIQMTGKKMILVFLTVMLVFTILSRALDSIKVPKVNIAHPQKGNLNYEISGTGKIEAKEMLSVSVLPDMKIRSVDAFEGKKIVSGETLFTFQMAELQEAYEAMERELEKLEISLEAEKLESLPLPKMSLQELAAQSLQKAEEILKKVQDKYEKAQETHSDKLAKIQADYEADQLKTKTRLLQDRYDAYMSAERSYTTALIDQEEAVLAARAAYKDAKRALEEGDGDEEALESEVKRTYKLVIGTEDKWDLAVAEANQNRLNKKNDYEAMKNGTEDGTKDLLEEYEASIERIDQELAVEAENLASAESTYHDALQESANAGINDSYNKTAGERERQLSVLRQKSIALSIGKLQMELHKLSELIAANGQVKAPIDGMVTKLSMEAGQITTGSEAILIGLGDLKLKGTISKESAGYLSSGDELSLFKDGRPMSGPVGIVESVIFVGDDEQAVITANLTATNLSPGAAVDFKATSSSPAYDYIIPIDALRKDNDGEYLLLVEDRKTILGIEQIAVRRNVTLLAKNSSKAAIEGGLSYDDIVISGSNKSIQEGDRVRVITD